MTCCCVTCCSEAADKVVKGEGKFEELVVCSQEIAASTTQLVVASKVGYCGYTAETQLQHSCYTADTQQASTRAMLYLFCSISIL